MVVVAVAVEGEACDSPTHSFPGSPLVRLRHRDDAPSPLLLGILATETQKRMKRRRSQRNEG